MLEIIGIRKILPNFWSGSRFSSRSDVFKKLGRPKNGAEGLRAPTTSVTPLQRAGRHFPRGGKSGEIGGNGGKVISPGGKRGKSFPPAGEMGGKRGKWGHVKVINFAFAPKILKSFEKLLKKLRNLLNQKNSAQLSVRIGGFESIGRFLKM